VHAVRLRPRSATLADLVAVLCPHGRAACASCRLRAVTLFPLVRRRLQRVSRPGAPLVQLVA